MTERGATPWWRQGTVVLAVTTAASVVFRLASNIVLTRLLAPEAFGAVGVVTSVVAVLSLVSDMGFYAFIVRHKHGDNRMFLDCVWTIRLMRSIVLAGIMAVGAVGLASAYGQPDLAPALVFAASFFLLDGISSLGFITAARHERVSFVSLFEFALLVFQIALTLALAYWLRSYWAILLSGAIGGGVKAVLSFTLIPGSGRRLRYSRELAREVFHFSKYIIGSSTITLVLSQTDKVIFSRIFSISDFGLLLLGASLAQTLTSFSFAYVVRVTYPRLARVFHENPEGVSRELYQSRRIVALLFALAAGGVAGGADLIVRILFDDRYLSTGLYLSIFALAPAANLNALFSEQTLVACGHVRATLHFNLVRIVYLLLVGPLLYVMAGPIGLLLVFGTIDVAPMLVGWWRLRGLGILVLREEIVYCVIFLAGYGLGVVADQLAIWMVSGGLIPPF
jgi:lipopolysaccharide exporter